ncbi:MAG: branched-chain amino acid ABC transporter permease [Chloroflexota bacterium]
MAINPSISAPQPDTRSSFRAWIRQPRVAATLIIGYIVIALIVLVSLDRRNVLFPILSTLAFPPFILSPFVILASPLPRRLKTSLILLLILIIMPLLGIFDGGYLELSIQIAIFAGLALGLNIVVGFAGLLDLGYIAFFAVGAYIWAMFSAPGVPTVFALGGLIVPSWAFFLFIPIGVLVAGGVGILLGLPVLRLRGDYLAIVTLGFGEMIRVIARNLDQPINFTNGSQGLSGVARPPLPGFAIDFTDSIAKALGISLPNTQPVAQQLLFYFIAIVLLGIIILVARRLDDSPIGRAWTAIREDEVAAIAMGVPLVKMKLLAFAAGAAFAGAIGVLYGAKQTFVSPESFSLIQSISILAMVIVGGLGGIKGVVLGAMIVTLLNLQILTNFSLQINALRNIDYVVPIINYHIRDWPTQLEPAKYQRLVFGFLLIVMMIFRPAGLLPEPRRKMEMRAHAEPEELARLEEPVIASEVDSRHTNEG